MIIFVVGPFRKAKNHQLKTHIVSHICYDAESTDDAKKAFLVTDASLRALNDSYSLELIHTQVADMYTIIETCEGAAKASLNFILEAATKARKETGQEGEE